MGDEAYQTKGLDSYFGFKINEPFYFRSKMPMQRVMEVVGASNIVLKRWVKNRNTQKFFFDGVSKTIKNQQWNSRSMHMQGNNLRLSGTTSRWY